MDVRTEATPGRKLAWAILIAMILAVPLFSVWLLVYDRENQAETARQSITEGWGGPQAVSGPILVVPYRAQATETVVENGQSVTRSREVVKELTIAPDMSRLDTQIMPERRRRSIYEAVVYEARNHGQARFALPADITRAGVDPATLDYSRAELRFGLSDPRGLGANPEVIADGTKLSLQPGQGTSGGKGFFAWLDASALKSKPIVVGYRFAFRGNGSLALLPAAGQTDWTIKSSWQHPSFGGAFLPGERTVADDGFSAHYRIGNLALGRSLVETGLAGETRARPTPEPSGYAADAANSGNAEISLIQPVDLYSRVDRSAKYGFLFIGFTFLALLMFDVIGGASVSAVEYLLTGAALVLFFVLLLALAEVIGFTPAYIVAAAAVAGLNTAYCAAVLKSWRRAYFIGALLVGLYVVLYILLSLEAFSLLIGSLLLFAALAGVMYATRNIDWGGKGQKAA